MNLTDYGCTDYDEIQIVYFAKKSVIMRGVQVWESEEVKRNFSKIL